MKDPQMLLPLDGVGAFGKEPWLKVKVLGTKKNDLLFFLNEDGSRSQMYSSNAYLKDGDLFFGHYGDQCCWYPDGKIKGIIKISKGKQHGEQISWYANGSLRKSWNWHYGEFHGRWMEWYENGVTSFQGHYRHGKKHGKWWEWYENGKMAVKAEFLDAYTLDLNVWKPDGERCEESGVTNGFGCWLKYEPNGLGYTRSEIVHGHLMYGYDEEDGEEDEEIW